jgi:hypothetical protein
MEEGNECIYFFLNSTVCIPHIHLYKLESTHPESPSSPLSSPREELLKNDEKQQQDAEEDKSSPESLSIKPRTSLRLRTKRKNSNGGGADRESQTSQFSRTSSSFGYVEESFGKKC